MRIEVDTERDVIEVDGVAISLDVLRTLVEPNPHKAYRFRRDEDRVIVLEMLQTPASTLPPPPTGRHKGDGINS